MLDIRKAGTLAGTVVAAIAATAAAAETKLVMLGTGTPVPHPDRVSSSTAVVHDGKSYVFDAGAGMVQRAIQASEMDGLESLHPTAIENLFFTHLHSDHVLDYPELASTLWWRRPAQITAHGPTGLADMTQGYYDMLAVDVALRTNGLTPVENPEFYKVIVEEHEAGGWTFEDGDVTIEAFDVEHGDIEPAFGYRVTTPDKVIVISGDTAYSDKVVEMARGADILVHEVISEAGLSELPEVWQNYHRAAHTTTSEVARVASEARPGLLVLTHVLHYGAPLESVLDEVKAGYDGEVVLANDLDVF